MDPMCTSRRSTQSEFHGIFGTVLGFWGCFYLFACFHLRNVLCIYHGFWFCVENLCVSDLYMFLMLFFSLCFLFFISFGPILFYLLLFYLILLYIIIKISVFFLDKKEKKYRSGWERNQGGGNGRHMGRGACNQSILYDQTLFSIKEMKEQYVLFSI